MDFRLRAVSFFGRLRFVASWELGFRFAVFLAGDFGFGFFFLGMG